MLAVEEGYKSSNDGNDHNWVWWKEESEEETCGDSRKISKKIKQLLKGLKDYTSENLKHDLILFWAPEKIGENCSLTTANQPFGSFQFKDGFWQYWQLCVGRRIYISGAEEGKPEQLGPVGRAFVNRDVEFSPDVGYYYPQEFQHQNDALRFGLSSLVALPVFETQGQGQCPVGVLEIWGEDYAQISSVIAIELESCGLRIQNRCNCKGSGDKELIDDEKQEITKVFREVTDEYPSALALAFIPRFRHEDVSCNRSNIGFLDVAHHNIEFQGSSAKPAFLTFNVLKEKGVAGKAFADRKSYFCRNIRDFSMSEYPYVHVAHRAGLNLSIAIYLQSTESEDHNLVVEFLLSFGDDRDSLLESVIGIVKKHLGNSFKIAEVDKIVAGSHNSCVSSTFLMVAPANDYAELLGSDHPGAASGSTLEENKSEISKDKLMQLSHLKRKEIASQRGGKRHKLGGHSSRSGEVAVVPGTLNYAVKKDELLIKVAFSGKSFIFRMQRTAKLDDLRHKVAERVGKEAGEFIMVYRLTNSTDDIQLDNDEDLSLCIEMMTSPETSMIEITVKQQ